MPFARAASFASAQRAALKRLLTPGYVGKPQITHDPIEDFVTGGGTITSTDPATDDTATGGGVLIQPTATQTITVDGVTIANMSGAPTRAAMGIGPVSPPVQGT